MTAAPDRAQLTQWTLDYLSGVLHIPADDIGLDRGLADLGLDSADSVLMSGEMAQRFGIEIDPASFLEMETIAAMIDNIAGPAAPHAA